MTVCKNCSTEFEGKFCPQCGQKAKTKRITTKQVLKETQQRVFHYEQGFWYTTRELITRPGHTIREYLEGKRARHIKPLKFMFWAAAISFLIFHLVGLDTEMLEKLNAQQTGNNPIGQRLSEKIFTLFMQHPAIIMFSMIPLIAFWSWLLFLRRGYNYAEHFVLSAFLMGEVSLASVIVSPISRLISNFSSTSWPMTLFSVGIWVLYFGWTFSQFFQKRTISVWLKGGFAILFGYFSMLIFISILILVVIIFFKPQLETWLAS